MKFTKEEQVKKWLRGLPLLKRELEMKIGFYADLMRQSRQMGQAGQRHEGYYLAQVERLQGQLKALAKEAERLFDTLEPNEKAVMTARYIKGALWDAVEFHVHFSRRQAIRLHNKAIQKLVGMEVMQDV